MIVEREVYKVKSGRLDGALEVIRQWPSTGDDPPMRVYAPSISPWGVIVFEWEFESLEARSAFWKAFLALPEVEQLTPKWQECIEDRVKTEIWRLAITFPE